MPATTRKATSRSNGSARSRASHSNSAQAALAEVKSDVAALRTDAGRLVQGLEEVAVEKAGQIAGRSKEEIVAAHERVKDYVGQRPITSLVIALGVGAVLARILR